MPARKNDRPSQPIRYRVVLVGILLAVIIAVFAPRAEVHTPQWATINKNYYGYLPSSDELYRQNHTPPPAWENLVNLEGLRKVEGLTYTYIEWAARRYVAIGANWYVAHMYILYGLAVACILLGLLVRPIIWLGLGALPVIAAGHYVTGGSAATSAPPSASFSMPLWGWAAAVLIFGALGFLTYIYIRLHVLPRHRRWYEDFFKIDRDSRKKDQLDVNKTKDLYEYHEHDRDRMMAKAAMRGNYFLGIANDDGKSIELPEQLLTKHMHILGGSGSGKTSRLLLPLALQFMHRDRGLLFMDFKGDHQASRSLYERSRQLGKRFWMLSLTEPSNNWNVLAGSTAAQAADKLLTALELIYEGPAKYYSLVQRAAFIPIFRAFQSRGVELTLVDFWRALGDIDLLSALVPELANDRGLEQLRGLRAALLPFSEVPPINAARPDVTLAEAVKNGDIVYAHLDDQVYTELAPAVGKMLYMSLLSIASTRNENDTPYFVIMDEFQSAPCRALKDMLSKVRSAQLPMICANQSLAQLNIPSLGGDAFRQVVWDNTAVKVVYQRTDGLEADFWAVCTGSETYKVQGQKIENGYKADGGRGTMLDGKRVQEGFISYQQKSLVHSNVFLTLQDGVGVVYGAPKRLATVSSFSHPWPLEEKHRLTAADWPDIEHPVRVKDGPTYETVATELRGTPHIGEGRAAGPVGLPPVDSGDIIG